MSEKQTGGAAFPSSNNVRVGDFMSGGHEGMTLRDYFAAKALPTVVKEYGSNSFTDIAVISYQIADAMLEARKS